MSSWRKDKKARKEKKGWRREEQEWEGVLICDDSLEAQREKESLFLTLSFTLLSCYPSSISMICSLISPPVFRPVAFFFVYLYINFFRDLSVHLVPVCFPVWVFVLFHVCPCIFIIFYACACFHWWKLYARQLNFSTLHSHSVCIQITQFPA